MSVRPNILITGATGGFGRAVARRFYDEGYYVDLTDLDADALQELQHALGDPGRTFARVLDVTSPEQARTVCAAYAQAAGGGIQVLLNNAGISAVGGFAASRIAQTRAILDVNLFGVMNVTHAALPHLRGVAGAHIISVSSASALHGNPELPVYAATKRAILSFSESLDIELRGQGIRVSDLLPIYAETAIVHDVYTEHRVPPDIELSPADIAEEVWDIVRTGRFRSYVGTDTKIFARLGCILPYRVRRYVTRRVLGW